MRSGSRREEASTPGDAGVVDEQIDPRVARQDRRGRLVDVAPVGDVAHLVLGAELGGQWLQPLLAAGDQHAVPALPRQLPRGRGADPAGCTGDDGHLHAADLSTVYLQTRTTRCASALRPFASVTIALSVCLPFAAPPRFQTEAKRPAPPRFWVAIGFWPSRKRTERSAAVDEASTRSRVWAGVHSFASGVTQVIGRAVDDGDVAGGEGGVRKQLVADGVDVLRLLEVGGGRGQQPLPGLQRRCLPREWEERDPADGVVSRGCDQGRPYPIRSEYGSTPAPRSRTRSAIVGRPAATRLVIRPSSGGCRSSTQARSTYDPPARGR